MFPMMMFGLYVVCFYFATRYLLFEADEVSSMTAYYDNDEITFLNDDEIITRDYMFSDSNSINDIELNETHYQDDDSESELEIILENSEDSESQESQESQESKSYVSEDDYEGHSEEEGGIRYKLEDDVESEFKVLKVRSVIIDPNAKKKKSTISQSNIF